MKALAIGFENEEYDQLTKLIENNFSKQNIYFYKSSDELVEVLTSTGPFSYVLVNLDEKHYSTPELYESIIDIIGMRPFILIGTPNAIKSQLTHELLNNHRTIHVIEVPVIPHNFKKAIAHCAAWIKGEEFEQSIQEFAKSEMRPLRIKTFFLFEQLPYDVYLELMPNKYGKIISKNRFYSHQLLHSYSKKNIRFLYIRKNEHLQMLDETIKNLIIVFKTNKIEKSKILKMQQKAIFFIQEYIKCLTVTDEVNTLSHLLSESMSDYAFNNRSMFPILNEVENIGQITFTDASFLTAYLCQMIILEMQWSADMTKERLVLAAILQDIHLQNEELIKVKSLQDPKIKEFTEDEILQFQLHPLKAQEVARLFHGYTELDFILKEHHEHPTGEGFPAGVNVSSLTTISCIFIIATHFTSRLARSETSTPNIKELVSSMKKIYCLGNFKDPMKAVSKIFP